MPSKDRSASKSPRGRSVDSDVQAILWAIACCWLGVWSNFALLHFGAPIASIVPFDLFAVPLVVTGGFWLARRLI